MTNKHENMNVSVYWDDVSVPGWKLSGLSNDTECVAETETETEDSGGGDLQLHCFSLHTFQT
jgi:hypothetical protein